MLAVVVAQLGGAQQLRVRLVGPVEADEQVRADARQQVVPAQRSRLAEPAAAEVLRAPKAGQAALGE